MHGQIECLFEKAAESAIKPFPCDFTPTVGCMPHGGAEGWEPDAGG